jgi:hypothetical protein
MSQTSTPQKGSRLFRFVVAWAVGSALVLIGGAIFLFVHMRKNPSKFVAIATPGPSPVVPEVSQPVAATLSKSVSIALGEEESGQGLKLRNNSGDGSSTVEQVDGVAARALRLEGKRTTLNLYLQIDPAFKQQDASSVRIDVEYLDPNPGTMGIHYDARDTAATANPIYREADAPIRLTGSGAWRKATFRTKDDAAFSNRQNGQSDFRIWAKTPVLFLRNVTVTRQASPSANWTTQFAGSNQVNTILGAEKPDEDGLRHLAYNTDGRTPIENVDGVPCRHLDRMAEGRMFGSSYFAINPSFKAGLTNARVEIEYFAKAERSFRVQFDGMDGDMHQRYLPVLAEGATVMRFGTGADYATAPEIGHWAVATFHLTNAVFRNSQKGGADFRIEVVPPDIYLRRVTVTREDSTASRK